MAGPVMLLKLRAHELPDKVKKADGGVNVGVE